MRVYQASTTIEAPAEAVWAALTDASSYPDWDPGMNRVEGQIAQGQKISAYTQISPDRAFPVTVTELTPHLRMIWTGGMPLGLFKSVRTFTLTSDGNGRTEIATREEFSGLLLPVFGGSIPDLTEAFQTALNGLKAWVEAKHN